MKYVLKNRWLIASNWCHVVHGSHILFYYLKQFDQTFFFATCCMVEIGAILLRLFDQRLNHFYFCLKTITSKWFTFSLFFLNDCCLVIRDRLDTSTQLPFPDLYFLVDYESNPNFASSIRCNFLVWNLWNGLFIMLTVSWKSCKIIYLDFSLIFCIRMNIRIPHSLN